MTSTDQRYTDEAIRKLTLDELMVHLDQRTQQRDRARHDLDAVEASIEAMTDYTIEETDEGKMALRNARSLAREIREQNELIMKLDANVGRATIERDLREPADARTLDGAGADWIQASLEQEGLPGFDLGDDDTAETTRIMWMHATLALEAHTDETPTCRAVAERVIAAWEALYSYPDDDTPADADRAPGHGLPVRS